MRYKPDMLEKGWLLTCMESLILSKGAVTVLAATPAKAPARKRAASLGR
jgi:hypothetical protein